MVTSYKQKPMTKQERAVAVAKDVLKHLRYLKLQDRVYIEGKLNKKFSIYDDLKQHVTQVEKNCRVCMKGALLLSKARLFNDVLMGEIVDKLSFERISASSNEIVRSLDDTFDKKTINLAEVAFERDFLGILYLQEAKNAITFSCKYKTRRQVVEAVMKNIIKNKGNFIPPNLKWKEEYFRKEYNYRVKIQTHS